MSGRIPGKLLIRHDYAFSFRIELPYHDFVVAWFCNFGPWSNFSDDYSTDEEYLNTIAGFEDDSDDEEERARRAFNLVDHDGSGQISMDEFLKYSRHLTTSGEAISERSNRSLSAKQLEVLEKKVDDNAKKLERICKILEVMKSESTKRKD